MLVLLLLSQRRSVQRQVLIERKRETERELSIYIAGISYVESVFTVPSLPQVLAALLIRRSLQVGVRKEKEGARAAGQREFESGVSAGPRAKRKKRGWRQQRRPRR